MDHAASNRLKQFIQDNIPFHELKQAGFFNADLEETDYESIAARVCTFFGLKSIYQYASILNVIEHWVPFRIDADAMATELSWMN
jgi:hypothetical protein